MNIIPTEFPDVYIIESQVFSDERGFFFENFNINKLKNTIGDFQIIQGNESKSKNGVIRGLHFQKPPYSQAKLVEVIKGKIFNVIVDLRIDSPTFGKYLSIMLNDENKKMLYIPKGFAHGFITLSKNAISHYYVDNVYSPESESGIIYNDDVLNINWHKRYTTVSNKDQQLKGFNEQTYYTKEEWNK